MNQTETLTHNLIHRVNVGDSLTRTAARLPRQPALVDGERRLTYREFNAAVNRFAHGLLARGYQPGDVLVLVSGNSIEFLIIYYACAKTGVVSVPINLAWGPKEIAFALGHCRARGIVLEAQLMSMVEPAVEQNPDICELIVAQGTADALPGGLAGREILPFEAVYAADTDEPEVVVGDRDPITYLYTSGTTSEPKGVVASHTAIYLESMMMALEAGFSRDDRFACLMPLFHTAQLNVFCSPAVMVGATQYLMRGFDAPALLDLIEREGITIAFALPMMWRALLEDPSLPGRDLSSLRKAAYAMAPMPDALLRKCIETFDCDFFLLFGQTEMSPTTTLFRPEHQLSHAGAVGTQVANVQIAVMSEEGELLPPGNEGEIVYRGPQTLEGYLYDPEATEAVFAHGWFHSGDAGYFAEDGMLWFSDRYKDVIKSGGENVSSIEVEKAVYAADERIAEAVVVGLPHAHWTEAITAVVTAKPGETLDEARLLAAVRERLPGFKAPKAVIVVNEIPKTATGKLRKNVVREQFGDYYANGKQGAAQGSPD
jgi:acyl-CoA synthetase (AMP-forming)/AMP-acid ligase II